MVKNIKIPVSGEKFKNNVQECVGTGRMGLALQKEYLDHLKMVQDAVHFRYIRGHGLFCDDVGIYRESEIDGKTHVFYNFTYLDRIFDSYLENGIKPFLELGFMPEKLKSGEKTVFYWKGNVTPPRSYEKWKELVSATMNHLIERYGREEVITWPVEVWNEPNIGFWSGSMEEYFKLYDYSVEAVKEADPRIKIGGPAVCSVEPEKWLRGFIEHCIEKNIPLDFITRHSYSANITVDIEGHKYETISDASHTIEELKETRDIMNDYPETANIPLHLTEFNSSYVQDYPVHDSTYNAAYIARILSEAGEYADSYSYWTFSDVFEESDVPKSAFHGGFGMIALNSIKKPTFYAFEFFGMAGSELLYRDENVVVTKDDNRYVIIGWNYHDMREHKEIPDKSYSFSLNSLGKQAVLVKRDVGGEYANPVQAWSNLGKPRTLDKKQKEILRAASEPLTTTEKLFEENGSYEVDVNIPYNHLCMLEIIPVNDQSKTYFGLDEDDLNAWQ